MADGGTKKKVLLVEDDKFLRKALHAGLVGAGLDVTVASDGREGLDAMKREQPDLVLLDLIMPVKDGFEVLEDVRLEGGTLASIPIIVLSNLGQESDIRKCRELGAVDYFIKTDMPMKEVVKRAKYHLAKRNKAGSASVTSP